MWRASSAGSSLSQPSEQMTTMEPRTVVPTRPVRSTLGSARCRCGDWPDVEGPRGNDPGEGVLAVPTRRRRRPPRSPRQEEGNRKVDGPTDVAAWAVCGRCRKRCVSAPSATCGPRGEPANLPKPRRSVVRGPGRARCSALRCPFGLGRVGRRHLGDFLAAPRVAASTVK